MSEINGSEIIAMVGHFLKTPLHGYLGSDYGEDIKRLLITAQSDAGADDFIEKLKNDVPITRMLPEGQVNLFGVNTQPDRLDLYIEVAGNFQRIENNDN